MPTVIDEFVVTLGLDPSKFTAGQKDALESARKLEEGVIQTGKTVESQGRRTADVVSTLKKEMLGFVGVALGAREAKEFFNYVTDLDASTSRLARTMDMSTSGLSAWQGAAQQAGGSAESITSTLGGITGEMNKFLITGQTSGPFMQIMGRLGGLFNADHTGLKDAGEVLKELSGLVQGMDPARASAFLSMIPGMNQDTINLLLQGPAAIEEYLEAARRAGVTTDQSAAQAREYQKELALLEQSATNLGRGILGGLMPSLISLTQQLREKIHDGTVGAFLSAPSVSITPGSIADVISKLIEGDYSNNKVQGLKDLWNSIAHPPSLNGPSSPGVDLLKQAYAARASSGGAHPSSPGVDLLKQAYAARASSGGAHPSLAQREAYIRSTASALGIDPDQAMRVARSEGFGGLTGDQGTSFGDFQLHTGGGLGDIFQKQTGKNPADPANWQAADRFALEWAKSHGWGAWHGWKGLPFAGIGGLPGAGASALGAGGGRRSDAGSSNSVSVGQVNVTLPGVRDAQGFAQELPAALSRTSWAASVNYGLSG